MIVALVVSLFPGLAAISLAYQLQKKYRLAHLSTYLYFQIFINAFGIYGISGQVMARRILEIHLSSFQTIKTIEHFFPFSASLFLFSPGICFLDYAVRFPRKTSLAHFPWPTFLQPVLFWKNYLRNYAVAPSLQDTTPDIMKRFLEAYKISKREEEVIQQLCAGRTNKEISQVLFISLQTVKDHIYRIYQKTDVKNRVQLINLIQSYKGKDKRAGR